MLRINSKILAVFLSGMGFLILFSTQLLAQEGKIGYIDSMKLRTTYKEFADVQVKFDQEVAKWQLLADSLKKGVDSLQVDFDKQSLLLSEEKKKEKEHFIEQKKTEYTAFVNQTFGPGGKMEKLNTDLTKPILDKINVALEKIALENNYIMIFDAVNGNVAWAKKGLDLTDMVLDALSKMQ